jgi:hypothetical protein
MAKKKKTPPEVFARQQQNIDRLRSLLNRSLDEDKKAAERGGAKS